MRDIIPVYKPYLPKKSLKYAQMALKSGWVSSNGEYILSAENKLQELLEVKHVLLTNNGTSATHLLSRGLKYKYPKIKYIISPNNVFIAAWNGFLYDKEYIIKTVDADINTWNIDENKIDNLIDKESALLIVHNMGNIINVPNLIRKYKKLIIIEDACEGFGGKYEGFPVGSKSLLSSISFFGNKNITSGEGGAVLTNDDDIYLYLKEIRGQGQSSKKFIHNTLGYNYRITNVASGLLLGQIELFDEIMNKKQKIFDLYKKYLFDINNIVFVQKKDEVLNPNWMFAIRIIGSEYIVAQQYFLKCGIDTRPMFYPISAHKYLQENNNICQSNNDVANILNKECIIFPSFPELSKKQVKYICDCIQKYIKLKIFKS